MQSTLCQSWLYNQLAGSDLLVWPRSVKHHDIRSWSKSLKAKQRLDFRKLMVFENWRTDSVSLLGIPNFRDHYKLLDYLHVTRCNYHWGPTDLPGGGTVNGLHCMI